jgi:L-lactate dehydrogenase (cytochrome)
MISNHGGRQLDGSRAPFDQLREIVDAVGGRDRDHLRRRRAARHPCAQGAVRRGNCASGGRLYLYALAAAGQAGVERALSILLRTRSSAT